MEAPKINLPKIEPKPEPKPVELESKLKMPEIKAVKPAITLAPQPKAVLAAAAPAVVQQQQQTAAVHLGAVQGVTPNPNAIKPATVAAIGNPYGGAQGAAALPHGVVGSTGISNGTQAGSNAGAFGHVALTGIPGGTGTAQGFTGNVGSV